MEKSTKEILIEILKQSAKGFVNIETVDKNGSWSFDVNFLTNYQNTLKENPTGLPVLKIQNFDTLVAHIDNYLKSAIPFYANDKKYFELDSENHKKKLILDLFINATPQDFENFLPYLNARTSMLETNINPGEFLLGEYDGLKVISQITKNCSNLEAPFDMEIIFSDNQDNYKLPKITFGIDDKNIVNIYSIQHAKNLQKNSLYKKLDRHIRKLNKNVEPESDIANISPSSLVALTIFISKFEQMGINKFAFHTNMPIRYQSHLSLLSRKTGNEDFAQTEADRIEFNTTNRLLYTAQRFCHHFPNSNAEFDDITGILYLKANTLMTNKNLSENPYLANNIVYDIANICKSKTEISEQEK